jgi:peptide/nickel transport system ATP-binding protein
MTAHAVALRDLKVRFPTRERVIHALNGVDLTLERGEVLGILGESGSGKSVMLRALMRLLPRNAVIEGAIGVEGRDVLGLDPSGLRALRGPVIAMVFQEPMTALDPVYPIGHQIAEPIRRHQGCSRASAMARAKELLDLVQVPSAARRLAAYPHELSGGLRQRAMIAIALSCRPQVLLADEPTTALDATVQIQILLLLRQLQRELGMAVIFVTHDIGVAAEISDRIAVMYAGRIVEQGSARDVIRTPAHPYAEALLASTIGADMRGRKLRVIAGAPPILDSSPGGCSFAPRCSHAGDDCRAAVPAAIRIAPERLVRCLRASAAPDA